MGGRGFVGQEIIALIDNHPYFELSQVFTKSNAGKTIPNYKKNKHLLFTELDQEMINIDPYIDIFILALANDDSIKVVNFLNSNFNKSIIIDVSSDHRFNDDWTYRLPETSNDEVVPKKISNPGCSATAMQLILAPIKKDDILGKFKVFYKDDLINEYNLYASEDIKKVNVLSRIFKSINFIVWGKKKKNDYYL